MADKLFPEGQPDEQRLAELKPSQRMAEGEKRREALQEAKASGDPDKVKRAKVELDLYRTWEREHREAQAAAANDGVARPDTVRAATAVKES